MFPHLRERTQCHFVAEGKPPVFQRLFGQEPLSLTSLPPLTYTNISPIPTSVLPKKAEHGPRHSRQTKASEPGAPHSREVEAIERALDGEAGCARIMHRIAGCRGAINSLLVEVVEDQIRTHLVDPAKNPEALDAEAAAQLIEVVHSYFR
jgi:DNA-binding FrmR family transcriptional regulator